jgi:putative zinc finger protein
VSCPQLVESGVYVLGALAPAQRLAFEAHMDDCAVCRAEVNELAVLPGLLGRLDEPAVARVADRLNEPAMARTPNDATNLIPKVLIRVHRQRRNRRFAALAGAVAVACLALFAGLTMPHQTTTPRTSVSATAVAHSMRQVKADAPISAQVSLWPVDGGTQLRLKCTYETDNYLPTSKSPASFQLYVFSRNGAPPQQLGTWSAKPGQTLTIPGQTAWPMTNVARVELRSSNGTPLLEYDNT